MSFIHGNSQAPHFFQSAFLPQDSSLVIELVSRAANIVQNGNFIQAHLVAPGYVFVAAACSSLNVPSYAIRGTSSFVTHVVDFKAKEAIQSLSSDALAAAQSLFFTVIGVIITVSAFFYPNLIISIGPVISTNDPEQLAPNADRIAELETQVQNLQGQLQQATVSQQTAEDTLSSEQASAASNAAEYEAQIQELTEKITILQEQLGPAENNALENATRIAELETQVRSLHGQLEEATVSQQTAENTLSSEQASAASSAKEYTAQIQELTAEIKHLQEQLAPNANRIAELETQVRNLQGQLEEATVSQQTAENILSSEQEPAASNVTKYEAQIQKLTAEIKHLQEERDSVSLKQKISINKLMGDVESYKKVLGEYKAKIPTIRKSIQDDYQNKLINAKAFYQDVIEIQTRLFELSPKAASPDLLNQIVALFSLTKGIVNHRIHKKDYTASIILFGTTYNIKIDEAHPEAYKNCLLFIQKDALPRLEKKILEANTLNASDVCYDPQGQFSRKKNSNQSSISLLPESSIVSRNKSLFGNRLEQRPQGLQRSASKARKISGADVWNTSAKYETLADHKYRVVVQQSIFQLELKLLQKFPDNFTNLKSFLGLLPKKIENSSPVLFKIQEFLCFLIQENDPREAYQNSIAKLREVIELQEYEALRVKDEDLLTDNEKIVKTLIREFCLMRFGGEIYMYDYLQDIVKIAAVKQIENRYVDHSFFNNENENLDKKYTQSIVELNEGLHHSPFNKGALAIGKQNLSGALGLEDFNGNMNTPHLRNVQVYKKNNKVKEVRFVRHGSPTAPDGSYVQNVAASLGQLVYNFFSAGIEKFTGICIGKIDTGEKVTVDYEEYLRALAEKKQSELYCSLQKRQPESFENEFTRAKNIESLQGKFDNFHVIVQPRDGDLYNHTGDYKNINDFEGLKKAILHEFFDKDTAQSTAALPKFVNDYINVKEKFKQKCAGILDFTRRTFFSSYLEKIIDFEKVEELQTKLQSTYKEINDTILTMIRNTINLNGSSFDQKLDIPNEILDSVLKNDEMHHKIIKRWYDKINSVEELRKWLDLPKETEDLKTLKSLPGADKEFTLAVISSILAKEPENSLNRKLLNSIKKAREVNVEIVNAKSTWQNFIQLFYFFQRQELLFLLDGANGYTLSVVKNPCKDFLDRGGSYAFEVDRILHRMLGQENDTNRKKEALYNLLGPPVLVKKKGVVDYRLAAAINLENFLNGLTDPQKEALKNYSFGENWKIADILVRNIERQTEYSTTSRQHYAAVRKELILTIREYLPNGQQELTEEEKPIIAKNIHETTLPKLRKYLPYYLDDWQTYPTDQMEELFVKESLFVEELIEKQVGIRELERSKKGVEYTLATTNQPQAIENYKMLKEKLLSHQIVGQNQQKALHVLCALQQGIAGDVLLNLVGVFHKDIDPMLFSIINAEPNDKNLTVRNFHVDLQDSQQITVTYTDIFCCKQNLMDVGQEFFRIKAEVKVVYTSSNEDNKLESKAYFNWNLLDIAEPNQDAVKESKMEEVD